MSLHQSLPSDVFVASIPVTPVDPPFSRPDPLMEYIFLHNVNPLGHMHGWIREYTYSIPSPIVHICDDELHIGTLDLSKMLELTDQAGVLTIDDVICFVGHFMGSNLLWGNYQKLDDDVKRCVSLAFKQRILGTDAEDNTDSKDWEHFVFGRVGSDMCPPRNSDLFLGRGTAWKFTIWNDYSVLWVSEEYNLAVGI